MTTLTTAQKAYLRAKSGDDCSTPVVDDETLQVYYDASGDSLPCTIVSVLEDRWAHVKAGASKLTDLGTAVDTSEMDHIKDLLDYWRPMCGAFAVGQSSVYTYRADSLQTSEPTYARTDTDE